MTLRAEKFVAPTEFWLGLLCARTGRWTGRQMAKVAKSPVAEQTHFVLKIKATNVKGQIGGPHEAMSS